MSIKEVPGAALAPLSRLGPRKLAVLKKRAEFLRAARGRRVAKPGFVLQGWDRKDDTPPRIGFTCSKKVGNAVTRNRAKRRLREIARAVLPKNGADGWDYVLIGRAGQTATVDFAQLQRDLTDALAKLHVGRR